MNIHEKANYIKQYLSEIIYYKPDCAIILGSGLGDFAAGIDVDFEVSYEDIPHFPTSTVKGHKGRLIFGTLSNKKIVAMQGRFHLYEGYDVGEATLPIMVFHLLGIKKLIITNAAGGINADFKPTDLMVITDHIGFNCPSPLVKWHNDYLGERFPSMSEVYSLTMQQQLYSVAKEYNIALKNGVYCYSKGPAYETPAEIRAFKTMGADAVGMSSVPEAILAKYLGMEILGISCITNMAAGISNTPLSHQEVIENAAVVKENFCCLLTSFIERLQ